MKRFGLFLVCLVIGAVATSSCAGTAGGPAASGSAGADTKPYGSLKAALDFSRISSTDPQAGVTMNFLLMGSAFLDDLVGLNTDGDLAPGIAERWEIANDGLTHTFYLRKGVKFHDGSDLTGEDVKFSIERIMAPESTAADVATWRAAISSVELKDPFTVVLHLKLPQFELIRGFDGAGTAAVVPKKYTQEKGVDYFRKNPMGSGPWKVVKYDPGIDMELEAVDNHWRAVPKFKSIDIVNVAETSTKVAMLKTGELDIADVIPVDSVDGLKAAGLRILNYDIGTGFTAWSFYDVEHPNQYALGDVRVRKALSLATNRQEMVDNMFKGYGRPGVFGYGRRGAFYWDDSVLKPDPYDPDQAKKLLAEAGYANGFSTKIWVTPSADIPTVAQVFSGYLRKIGVNANIEPTTSAAFRPMYYPKQVPQVWNSIFMGAGSGSRQFEKMVTGYHSTKGAMKQTNNPKLDELIDKVPMTLDPNEKKKLALQAAVMAKEEYSVISLVYYDTLIAYGPKVGGLTVKTGIEGLAHLLETITHAK